MLMPTCTAESNTKLPVVDSTGAISESAAAAALSVAVPGMP